MIMKRLLFTGFLLTILGACVFGQIAYNEEQFRAFDGKGNPVTIEQILTAIGENEAVFLGELHDDPIGHAVQAEIFRRAVAKYFPQRKIALSLEMFERDVQIVVDEYLNGLISEAHFLASSRPWANYKTDYRPMLELAKEKKLSVIAANAPRRYINIVSRYGREALKALSKDAKKFLPPLPYAEPSEAYAKKFKALMGTSPEAQMGLDRILASQSLWDATMAYAVATFIKKNKKPLVIHLNGGFHTESRLGTVEHLLKYRSKTKALVITIKYDNNFKTFDKAKHTDLGDFVILTAPKPKPVAALPVILDRMASHHKSLQTLRAQLMVVEENKQLGVSDTLIGSVNYLPRKDNRGAYVRIDWTKPVAEHLVVAGEDFELYRPRLNQVIGGRLRNLKDNVWVSNVLLLMTMSMAQLKDAHNLKYMGEQQLSDGVKTWLLEVTPKATNTYKTAEIWVDADGLSRQIRINQENGDDITILFSGVEKNLTLSNEIFRLKYPSTVSKVRV